MARRYFARIFVFASISEMSIFWRIRASLSVSPIAWGIPATLWTRTAGRRPQTRARGPRSAVRGLVGGSPYRLVQRFEHARQVHLGDQDLARLGALIARDHAPALHHVDQPAGPRVADPQTALEHRGGGAAELHHGGDGLAEQVV